MITLVKVALLPYPSRLFYRSVLTALTDAQLCEYLNTLLDVIRELDGVDGSHMALKSHVALAAASLLLTRYLAAADCNVSSNYTIIDGPDDSDGISSCGAIDGSLSLLFDSHPGDWPETEASVDLGSVSSVDGDLVIYPDAVPKKTSVTAEKLKSVGGELNIVNTDGSSTVKSFELDFSALEEVTSTYVFTGGFADVSVTHSDALQVGGMMRIYSTYDLETLSFGGLHTVGGDFSLDSNDDLKEIELGTLTTAEKAFSVQENSALESISCPKLTTVKGDVTIYKNTALTYFELSALEYAGTVSFTSNGDSPIVYFPYLETIGTGNDSSTSTFEDVSEITFSSLRTLQGAFTFQSTALEDLTIPLIRMLNGSITVEDNASLTTLALPRATYVQDMFVSGNDKLTNVTANALKKAGTISVKGSMTNVEFFGLEEVTGDFKVQGDDSMDCSWFDDNIKSIVKGKYSCSGNHETTERKSSTGGIEDTEGNPEDYMRSDGQDSSGSGSGSGSSEGDDDDSSSDGSSSSGSGSGKKGLSSGAMAGIGVGAALGALILLGLIGWFLWRRRKQSGTAPPGAAGARRGESRGSESSSKRNVFDGQMLGVRTKIEASNPMPSPSPSLGALSFGRTSFLSSSETTTTTNEKGISAWRTIRRVSDSSGESRNNAMRL
ncbi:hypothetical protein EDB81DRAFT_777995 [Dactylonectria macrodidyma]|uniref:Sporulation-specific protein Sps2p n=1 Tax=Dactylonectria macrodidyma TaxID=307937 RepID=A0A9P9FPL9_9HYPO|nr:hypothetical protein EDB81DRAFT_777995 [Dactylonectria macrodidyma]